MKKFLILICVAAFAFSCKKQEVQNSNDVSLTKPFQKDATAKVSSDPVWYLLGYGYNATGEYARAWSAKGRVINVQALQNAIPTAAEKDPSSSQDFFSNVGSNAETLSKGLSIRINSGDTSKRLFKGSFKASFDDSTYLSSKYVYAMYNERIIKNRMYFVASISTLQNYLEPHFVQNIQTEVPATIVNLYGTHVMTDILLGGNLEAVYRSETTNSSRETAAAAGLEVGIKKLFNLSTGANYNSTHTTNNYSQKLHYRVVGGSALIQANTVDPSSNVSLVDLSGWKASITTQTASLIDFNGDNTLIPIYEFVADPVKKQALKNYVDQYLLNNRVQLKGDMMSIHRYWSSNQPDHYYAKEYHPGGFNNYAYEGIEFKALASPLPGTTPVHRYWNAFNSNHYYQAGTATTIPTYVYEGLVFYVYSSQVPGTIPVYRYYNHGTVDHYYTVTQGSFPGYVYEGIAFYAFPK